MAVGILGGVFDPPHVGHVALARAALAELGLDELLVLVVADPGHKTATTCAETRLELAKVAFEDVPEAVVEIDRHARTVDSLEERRPDDAYFILGSDELASFESWKSPQRVLELVRARRRDAPRRVARRSGRVCANGSARATASSSSRCPSWRSRRRRSALAWPEASRSQATSLRRSRTQSRAWVSTRLRSRLRGLRPGRKRDRSDTTRASTPHSRSLPGEACNRGHDPRHARRHRLH